ncbi:MAG: DNA polymerase Y family protein, partial [Kutzneria sp.]|nr:DNA polymerase Y family protein [Kutzneria sp.]
IGVADGFFAAMVAARRGVIVPPGQSAEFLAPLDIRELHHLDAGAGEHAELLDVLWRLGLRTLGAFTTVPERDIASRFGAEGARVHRAARGEERRALSRRRPAPELTVSQTLDPPVDRVDTAGFVARRIAGRLQALLVSHGVSCLRMGIHARTANDENLVRVWRCVQPVSTVAVADQVRWQLEGWLCGGGGMPPPTAGVVELRLEPIDVVEAGRLQLDLVTATDADGRDRAGRALVHVQGLLGFDAVCTPVIDGGRGPVERARLVVWGEQRHRRRAPGAPWPGRLPPLSPVVIPSPSPQGRVVDMTGASVVVSRRCEINAAPHLVQVEGWPPMPVLAWSRPWPVDERWWATDGAVRCARLQVVVDRGPTTGCGTAECPDQLALLVACTGGRWRVEGIYG